MSRRQRIHHHRRLGELAEEGSKFAESRDPERDPYAKVAAMRDPREDRTAPAAKVAKARKKRKKKAKR